MRLLSLELKGIRRLADCKCHLGGKVTAIVGPNEAGKSTLLYALRLVSTEDAIPSPNLTRGRVPEQDGIVAIADWEVEREDLETLRDFQLKEAPVRLRVEKKADGGRLIAVVPAAERDPKPFDAAIRPLRRYLDSASGRSLPRRPSDDHEGDETELLVGDYLDQILQELTSEKWREWGRPDTIVLGETLNELQASSPTAQSLAGRATSALEVVLEHANLPDPASGVWKKLLERLPVCIEFQAPDRDLQSSYDLSTIDPLNPPIALSNLIHLSQLDLQTLLESLRIGDIGLSASVLRSANLVLEEYYGKAWTQSDLRVILDRDGTRLDILIEEVGGKTYVLNERSDGLRGFVALTAFLSKQEENRTVLLIDEAETHLHYDAQRDLVDIMMEQEIVQQVIYTTHSPGCLPADLGTGVRAIVPVQGKPGVSQIYNEFWSSNAPGFSPLLIMMGAGVAAFTTTRAAILAEGPSDMILLPSLIRRATGLASLPYHVAPGLSTTAPHLYKDFDYVASRLAYVVDGDSGGGAIRDNLRAQSFPDDQILSLGGERSDVTLEDLVSDDAYLQAVNSELRVTGQAALNNLPSGLGRYKRMAQECEAQGLETPSKVAIAGRLVWQRDISLSPLGRRVLKQLHKLIISVVE